MKDEILRLLRESTDRHISGEELSNRFGVSRTAVWKCINQLKLAGYKIQSQTNKGYKLLTSPDILTQAELQPLLNTKLIGNKIHYFDTIDSTNTYAKKLAEAEFNEGTVIIAEQQTAGRGRLGRNWISPAGKGIWMSILLKPTLEPKDAAKITLLTACAVCRAIEHFNIKPMIKWPNDILVNGKKLCGILTEMNIEVDVIGYVVVGIGMNVNLSMEDLHPDILDTATSIKIETGTEASRKAIIAEIINQFEQLYNQLINNSSINSIIDEYKSKSAVLGKAIRIINKKEEISGQVVDINQEGHLLVKLSDGTNTEISSGEVSIRGVNSYI